MLKSKNNRFMTQFATVLLLLIGWLGTSSSVLASQNPIPIFVSILPQQYFVERIGGNQVEVNVLVGPGQSPATYEPTPRQMAALWTAALYFRIGVPFEHRLMEKIERTFPDLNVVDTRKGIRMIGMSGGHHDSHHSNGADPHIWLDPMRVKIQARTICEALCRLAPARTDFFQQNLAAFISDLDAIHEKITNTLASYRGRSILVFHPSYGYFCEAYGLTQVAVEVDGKSPSAKQVARWIALAKNKKIKVIFVQPQFSASSVQAVAQAVGASMVPMDPLAKDYLANLDTMATRVLQALVK